jgi:hypothetical protein
LVLDGAFIGQVSRKVERPSKGKTALRTERRRAAGFNASIATIVFQILERIGWRCSRL